MIKEGKERNRGQIEKCKSSGYTQLHLSVQVMGQKSTQKLVEKINLTGEAEHAVKALKKVTGKIDSILSFDAALLM